MPNTVEQLTDLKTKLRQQIRDSQISASMNPLTETLMRVEWKLAHHESEELDLNAIEKELNC